MATIMVAITGIKGNVLYLTVNMVTVLWFIGIILLAELVNHYYYLCILQTILNTMM